MSEVIKLGEDEINMSILKGGSGLIITNKELLTPFDYDFDLESATRSELIWLIKCLQAGKFVDP